MSGGGVMEEPEEKEICAHCGRVCGDEAGGYAFARVGTKEGVKNLSFCNIAASDRPNCYSLVIRGGHSLEDCKTCRVNPALEWVAKIRKGIDKLQFESTYVDGDRRAEADRKILELHAPEKEWGYQSDECKVCSWAGGSCGCIGPVDDWPCETIQLIADAYGVERWTGK
jgi:hypothetical protein